MRRLLPLLAILFLGACISKSMKIVGCSNAICRGNEIFAKENARFEVKFELPSKVQGRIECYCELLNNSEHPLKGKVCGGWGKIEGKQALTKGWVADAKAGTNMTFTCYAISKGKKLYPTEVKLVITK